MPNCKSCNAKLYWVNYKKGDRPKNEDGSTHYCGKPQSKKIKGKLTPDEWKVKFLKTYRWKVPISCNICGHSFRPTSVCEHIRQDGFVEGRDTTTFYSDNWIASKKRFNIMHNRNKKK